MGSQWFCWCRIGFVLWVSWLMRGCFTRFLQFRLGRFVILLISDFFDVDDSGLFFFYFYDFGLDVLGCWWSRVCVFFAMLLTPWFFLFMWFLWLRTIVLRFCLSKMGLFNEFYDSLYDLFTMLEIPDRILSCFWWFRTGFRFYDFCDFGSDVLWFCGFRIGCWMVLMIAARFFFVFFFVYEFGDLGSVDVWC